MKILVAGSSCEIQKIIVSRLRREKHKVYTLSRQRSDDKQDSYHYNYRLTDPKLGVVLGSVAPDCVLFIGSFDERYNLYDPKSSSEYISGLSNLLTNSLELGGVHFVYMSDTSVYGITQNAMLTEESEAKPEDVRSLIIRQGELLCMETCEASITSESIPIRKFPMKSTILRFSDVYGAISEEGEISRSDFVRKIFEDIDKKKMFPEKDKHFSPIYASDAVDAVYKAIAAVPPAESIAAREAAKASEDEPKHNIYNISGDEINMSDCYMKAAELKGHEPIFDFKDDEESEALYDVTVDSSEFRMQFGFTCLIDIDTGFDRVLKNLQNPNKDARKGRKDHSKKGLFKIFAPFLENVAIFILIALLQIWLSNNPAALPEIALMTLYIVMISVTFGMVQSAIAAFLASGFLIFLQMRTGLQFSQVVSNLQVIVWILEYFIIATACGYIKDHLQTRLNEEVTDRKEFERELRTVNKINDSNVKIKHAYENRLINYEDSLAKIYQVIDELNSLNSAKVFLGSVKVVGELMNSSDVSIYTITGEGDDKMCRLMGKSAGSLREHRVSIPYKGLRSLAVAVEKDTIYVNRELDTSLPMMAAPVFFGMNLLAIVMLWDVEFEDLSLYNINRFSVLSRLVSSIIKRAYDYHNDMYNLLYEAELGGVLNPVEFDRIVEIYKEAKKEGVVTYKVVSVSGINQQTYQPFSSNELADRIKPLIRVNDYIGAKEDSTTVLSLLLMNTDNEGFGVVISRFERAGLTVEEEI